MAPNKSSQIHNELRLAENVQDMISAWMSFLTSADTREGYFGAVAASF
jgi:hypothetical protein